MNYQQIITDLKNKIYKPIYFLMGEEPYYIDKITDFIAENLLQESEKTFNQLVLYGKETDIGTVINAAKRYPMMANHQVVIIKEAQEMKSLDDLIFYVEKPLVSTILVINYKYKTLDKRKKLTKLLADNHYLFEFEKIYESKVPTWIAQYLAEKKCTVAANAAQILVENLGNDLSKIANEIDKLIITLPKDTNKITAEHIERNIGMSKDFNNYELNNALAQKNVLKANKIISYFGKNPKVSHITLTLSSLYFFFNKVLMYHFVKEKSNSRVVAATLKIQPFFVNEYIAAAKNYPIGKLVQIIALLREYDMKSKGIGNYSTDDTELLKELIFKIMH